VSAPLLVLANADPARKDVVIGALGASAALGGLTLVFLGVVIAGYRGFPGATPKTVLKRYHWAAHAILGAFALSLATTALSLTWLTTKGGGGGLYTAVLIGFFVQLAVVLVVALGTTYLVVLR
jgi:hypothetical protein